MKKIILNICILLVLCGCSFGGGKAPKQYDVWYTHKEFNHLRDYVAFENKEMRSCGMDPFLGESDDIKVNLCMEKKGWYLKKGPVCENFMYWDEPVCIQWRAKHSKPDAKPWR